MPTTRGLLLAGLLAALGAACATTVPAVPVAAGSRVVVRLYDAGTGIELALANESHPELRDVYSQQRESAALKLAPDQLVGELLASLDAAGFDPFGQPAAREPDRATSFLSVRHDGSLRVFPRPVAGDAVEQRQAFTRLKLVMDHYYRHVGSLQFVENPQGEQLFREDR
jgi:hypothetical protein